MLIPGIFFRTRSTAPTHPWHDIPTFKATCRDRDILGGCRQITGCTTCGKHVSLLRCAISCIRKTSTFACRQGGEDQQARAGVSTRLTSVMPAGYFPERGCTAHCSEGRRSQTNQVNASVEQQLPNGCYLRSNALRSVAKLRHSFYSTFVNNPLLGVPTPLSGPLTGSCIRLCVQQTEPYPQI